MFTHDHFFLNMAIKHIFTIIIFTNSFSCIFPYYIYFHSQIIAERGPYVTKTEIEWIHSVPIVWVAGVTSIKGDPRTAPCIIGKITAYLIALFVIKKESIALSKLDVTINLDVTFSGL